LIAGPPSTVDIDGNERTPVWVGGQERKIGLEPLSPALSGACGPRSHCSQPNQRVSPASGSEALALSRNGVCAGMVRVPVGGRSARLMLGIWLGLAVFCEHEPPVDALVMKALISCRLMAWK
jgi:hypothetical protein